MKDFFQTLLHAEQPVARHRRRLRPGRGQAAGREVLRHRSRRGRRSTARRSTCPRSRARRSSRPPTASRRTASTWSGRRLAASAPGDAELDLASLILADGLSSRLNKALVYDRPALHGRPGLPELLGDRELVRGDRDGAAGRFARRRSRRSSPTEIAQLAKTGPTPAELERAKTKQEFAVRHGPRGHRRLRRQVRPPQPVQHAASATRACSSGTWRATATPRPASVQAGRGAVPRHEEPPRSSASASRSRAALPRPRLDRSKQPASGRRQAVRGPEGPDGEARRTAWTSSSSSAASFRRSTSRSSRAPAPRPIPPGKAGLRPPDGHAARHGHRHAQGARDRGRAGRSRRRARGQPPAARARASRSRRSSATSTRRMAIVSDVIRNASLPGLRVRPREEAPPRHARAAGEERRTRSPGARRARCSPSAPSIPTAGRSRGCRPTIETLTRDDLVERFHADVWKPGSSALVVSGDVSLAEATALATPVLRFLVRRRGARRDDPAALARRPPERSTSSTARTRRRPT